MDFSTRAIHSGWEPDATGSIMPPIYMTSTFELEALGQHQEFEYSRGNNPNYVVLEKTLSSLEEADYATVFSSGMGALTSMVSMLSQGDKVVALKGVYGGTYRLFNKVMSQFGIDFIILSSTSLEEIKNALSIYQPKWLMFETPNNPLLRLFDIEACSAVAKEAGVMTVVDNTFASPYCQNPLKWGADIVWHSTTKYLSGHSDVLGGVVMTCEKTIKEKLDFARKTLGTNPSPFDCWLITRGVKTLAVRMERHQKNAFAVSEFLEKHPKVKHVYYPGLASHPDHAIAQKQMRVFGGMVSAELNFPFESFPQFLSSLKIFSLAESLGGIESLVCHPVTMTHAIVTEEERKQLGLNDRILRFSIGIEGAQDLIEDLQQALKAV